MRLCETETLFFYEGNYIFSIPARQVSKRILAIFRKKSYMMLAHNRKRRLDIRQ